MGRAEDLFSDLEKGRVSAIEDLFTRAKNEEAFLEFKRSNNHGREAHLDGKDRENLARALSGFANGEGGVLVWGVSTRGGEAAVDRLPLEDCNRFAGAVDHAVSGCTVPEVPGVRSIAIPLATGSAEGFVATLVPASISGPHQLVNGRTYLMRAGSTFQPVSHTVLAGMFGRKPQPQLSIKFKSGHAHRHVLRRSPARGVAPIEQPLQYTAALFVLISNDSGIPARDAYVSWRIPSLTGSITMEPHVEETGWTLNQFDARESGCMAKESHRLIPFSAQLAVTFKFVFTPPVANGLAIELVVGASSAAPSRQRLEVSQETLSQLLSEVETGIVAGQEPDLMNELGKRLLGLPVD